MPSLEGPCGLTAGGSYDVAPNGSFLILTHSPPRLVSEDASSFGNY